jgi:hypothetical protein
MWEVEPPTADHQFIDSDWNPITDPERQRALAQAWVDRRATPWAVAWHALEVVDYDLSGNLSSDAAPWMPPSPFAGHPHWRDLADLPRAWSRPEMLTYVEYCRERVRSTLDGMTEEAAATPLPSNHRYRAQPYAAIITALIGHTTEHASQIRQFAT